MEKKVIEFGKMENEVIQFDGQDVQVVPFISGALEAFLIDQYIQDYFYSSTDHKILPSVLRNYLGAELQVKLTILDRLTNVQISNADDPDYADRICTELWDLVVDKIRNYWDFEENLSCVIEEIKNELDLEKSVGGVINGLVGKLGELLDKLNNVSPDEMKKLVEDSQGLLKELEQSPASAVFIESERNKYSKVQ